MIFNPLFIDTELKQVNSIGNSKTKDSYLFQDIINVAKTLTEDRKFSHSSVLSNLLNDIKGLSDLNETGNSVLPVELSSLLSNINETLDGKEITSTNNSIDKLDHSILISKSFDELSDMIESALKKLEKNFDLQIHIEDGLIFEGSETTKVPQNIISNIEQKLINNEPVLIVVHQDDSTKLFNLTLNKLSPQIVSANSSVNTGEIAYQLSLEPVATDEQGLKISETKNVAHNPILTNEAKNNPTISENAQVNISKEIKTNADQANTVKNHKSKTNAILKETDTIKNNSGKSSAANNNEKLKTISYTGELFKELPKAKSYSEDSSVNNSNEKAKPISFAGELPKSKINENNVKTSEDFIINSDKSTVSGEKVINKEVSKIIPTMFEGKTELQKNKIVEDPKSLSANIPNEKFTDSIKSEATSANTAEFKTNNIDQTSTKEFREYSQTENKIIDKLLRKSMIESFERNNPQPTVKRETNIKLPQGPLKPELTIESNNSQLNSERVLIELRPKTNINNVEQVSSKLQSGYFNEMQNISVTRKLELDGLHKELSTKLPEIFQISAKPEKEKVINDSNSAEKSETTFPLSSENKRINIDPQKSERLQSFLNQTHQKVITEVKREVNPNISTEDVNNKQTDFDPNSLLTNSNKNITKSTDGETVIPKDANSESKFSESKSTQNVSNEKAQNTNGSNEQTQPVINQKEIKTEQQVINTQQVKVNTKAKEQPELNSKITDEINDLIISDKKDKAVISLEPATLGKIKIALEIIENKVTARLEVENQAAKEMLQNQVDFLRENINNNGVQISSVSISLQQQEQKNSKANKEKRKENNVEKNEVSEKSNQENNTKSLGYNTYEFLA